MTVYDNSHSRMVAWLKILLPLLALAILSTLFLVSRSLDPTLSIPFAEGELEDLARGQKIGNPSFSTVTRDGSAITLSAQSAQPLAGPQNGLTISDLRAVIETPTGLRVDITAPGGVIDTDAKTAELADGVTLVTSSGFSIKTERIVASLNDATVSAPGGITASGPFGNISAGQMVLQQHSADDTPVGFELVFKKGVKLVYLPPN